MGTEKKTTAGDAGRPDGDNIGAKAKDVVDQSVQATRDTTEASRDAAERIASGAKSLAGDAREAAEETAESARAAVDRVGTALRGVASELKDGSLQERTFGQLAQSLADVSDAVREKDLRTLSRDVSDFAKRNPLIFIGSAALLGFAAARLISKDRTDT